MGIKTCNEFQIMSDDEFQRISDILYTKGGIRGSGSMSLAKKLREHDMRFFCYMDNRIIISNRCLEPINDSYPVIRKYYHYKKDKEDSKMKTTMFYADDDYLISHKDILNDDEVFYRWDYFFNDEITRKLTTEQAAFVIENLEVLEIARMMYYE